MLTANWKTSLIVARAAIPAEPPSTDPAGVRLFRVGDELPIQTPEQIRESDELVDLRAEGRRKVFVFRDQPRRREDVIAYYGSGNSVRPLTFAAVIKDMKALIHNA